MENMTRDFTELKNAIVIQAVTDYRGALLTLSNKASEEKDIVQAKADIDSLEKFFYSDWYSAKSIM